jgi:protein SCO1/2
VGSLVDQVLLFCFRYDPTTGRYSALTLNVVRVAGGLTVAVLVFGVTFMLRRERHRPDNSRGTA